MSGTGINMKTADVEKANPGKYFVDELSTSLAGWWRSKPKIRHAITPPSRNLSRKNSSCRTGSEKPRRASKSKPNICARWKGEGGSREVLLLSGHMDVVPGGEGWSIPDPFDAAVRDGSLHGRGTADMKGALAAQLFAYKALLKAGVPSSRETCICSLQLTMRSVARWG